MSALHRIVVTGLGTGYLPVAPGTWGSAVIAGLYLLVACASGGSQLWVTGVMAVVLVAASAACVALGPYAEKQWGRKDPGRCVIDEWAGQALTYVALPLTGDWYDWLIVCAAGFVAFRLFDIVKVPPAPRLEKLPGGWGILADDLAAGVYANVVCQLAIRCAFGFTC